jgi:hypothetical protein
MQRIFFFPNDYGVTGVIATLIANYIFDFVAEQVSCFSLALIAPLSTK